MRNGVIMDLHYCLDCDIEYWYIMLRYMREMYSISLVNEQVMRLRLLSYRFYKLQLLKSLCLHTLNIHMHLYAQFIFKS